MSTHYLKQSHFDLRSRVLNNAINVSAVAAPLAGVILFAQTYASNQLSLSTLLSCIYTVAFPLLAVVSARLTIRTSGIIYISLMMFLTFLIQLGGGITVSATALQLLILILAGVLFGVRGVVLTLVINLASFSLAGFALLNGYVPPIDELLWDPSLPMVWVRAGLILTFFGGASAMAVTYTIARLEQETHNLQKSLEREKSQHSELENAERQKAEAVQVVSEAQRVESLGRLASGVAHDFNNSLTVITSAAELAQLDPNISEQTKSTLSTIKKAALQAADMTRSLLAIARKEPSQLTTLEARELYYSLTDSISRLLPEDIELSFFVTSEQFIEVDQTQLERAILNIIVNARDAIESSGKIVFGCRDVSFDADEKIVPKGDYVEFWIEDNGSGMSEKVQKHIFEPFYTTKSAGAGTGMGMGLVHSFVSQANGAIDIHSTEGEGTTVSLYLPQTERKPIEASLANATAELQSEEINHVVLIVEDNPDVLASTADTLKHAGFDVLIAEDGNAALDIVHDEAMHFDLLCIDGVIPGASSAEVIEQVQTIHAQTKIVVCSGYVEEELVLRGIRTGEFAYVRKPYLGEDLIGCIKNELGISSATS